MGPDDKHLELIRNQKVHPVFILGFHRSGTSILYKMLTATGCFNPVTAYHIIHYDTLLDNHVQNKTKDAQQKLTDTFQQQGLDDRAIDTLKVTADFAEEYGFLLDRYSHTMKITTSNNILFTTLCQKIQYLAENDKPILLKNPYDFSNFMYLKTIFPNAQFIFIHRHPYKTISSTINAMQLILEHKNFYTAKLSKTYIKIYENPLLLTTFRFLFSHLSFFSCIFLTVYSSSVARFYLNNIKKLPPDDYVSITYEKLCKNPQEIIQQIMKKFHLTPVKQGNYTEMIKPRKITLHPVVIVLRKFIYTVMKRYCDTFSYTTEAYE